MSAFRRTEGNLILGYRLVCLLEDVADTTLTRQDYVVNRSEPADKLVTVARCNLLCRGLMAGD
jgi:hypothetical protein